MAVTIRDVAKAAQVSETAVSAVMGRTGRSCTVRVGAETRRRILTAAKQLGYSPNVLASGLRKGKTFTVGVILEAAGVEVSTAKAQAIENIAYANGYRLFTCHHGSEVERMEAYIQDLLARQVDGLIVEPVLGTENKAIRRLAGSRFPLVVFSPDSSLEVDRVCVDNVYGGYLAARHMVEIGRTKMAFIHGMTTYPSIQGRMSGWRKACEEAGLTFEDMVFMEAVNEPIPATSYDACQSLISSGHAFDAIVGTNDLVALGAIKALQDRGYRVPGDVAVIGFDDNQFSRFLPVPLTTVRQPTKELGEAAFELLMKKMEHPELPFEAIAPKPSLVVRQSTMVARRNF